VIRLRKGAFRQCGAVGVDQVNVLIPEAAVAGGATTLTSHFGNSGVSAYVYLK